MPHEFFDRTLKALTKPYMFTRTFTLAPTWELQEYVCQAILDGIE